MSQLELSLIRTDGGTQPRADLNSALIDEYVEAMTEGAQFPPVTVFYDGTSYWLADGFHRLEAAKKSGSLTISVDLQQGTCRDAVLHSVGANAIHGLRRSNADKRRAVLTLLSDPQWSLWSNNEVAKRCGVAEGLVRKLKEELSSFYTKIDQKYAKKCGVDVETLRWVQQRLELHHRECIVQRKGKTYTINTANIGGNNGRCTKRVTSTETSTLTKDPEAKPKEIIFSPSSLASLLPKPAEPQVVAVSTKDSETHDKQSEHNTTKAIDWLSEKRSGVTTKAPPEVSEAPGEPQQQNVRIISVKQESHQQGEEIIQTFEVAFSGSHVKIEGCPDSLVTLFIQMRDNPLFAEQALQQARLLAIR